MASLFNRITASGERVFKSALQTLQRDVTGISAGQPQMIIGTQGSGKTFLMRKLFDEVSRNKELQPVWVDGRRVFSNEDLLHNTKEGGRCVLFVDDFNYYLKRTCESEQFALRGILSEKKGPLLIGSAPAVMPQLTHYGAAFFEGFRFLYLKPLSDHELMTIIGGTLQQNKRAGVMFDFLPKTPGAAIMVSCLIRESSSREEDIRLLIERVSPLYQNKFDTLLPQQQRILCALSGEEKGLQLSGLRAKTGQETGKISPYLTQMVETGILSKESISARGGFYTIADPLFDLWLSKPAMSYYEPSPDR